MIEIRHRPHDPEDGAQYVGLAIGILGAIVLSGLLTPLRTTLSASDFALALVVPVLLAAVVGGRWAGALSAVVAALCFDFFFTKPYLSLRIASRNDITSFIVLLIVAMITAEVGIRARRGGAAARESRSELDRLYRVAEFSARGGDVDDVVSAVRAAFRAAVAPPRLARRVGRGRPRHARSRLHHPRGRSRTPRRRPRSTIRTAGAVRARGNGGADREAARRGCDRGRTRADVRRPTDERRRPSLNIGFGPAVSRSVHARSKQRPRLSSTGPSRSTKLSQ